MEWGVTQWYPMYPNIFNTVVNSVVRATFLEVFDPQEAHHGIVWESGYQKNGVLFRQWPHHREKSHLGEGYANYTHVDV